MLQPHRVLLSAMQLREPSATERGQIAVLLGRSGLPASDLDTSDIDFIVEYPRTTTSAPGFSDILPSATGSSTFSAARSISSRRRMRATGPA